MKAALFAFSRRGVSLGERLQGHLKTLGFESALFAPKAYLRDGVFPLDGDLHAQCKVAFATCQALIFIGATGIAVRSIAPFVKSKKEDPAVLSLDDGANFVISLLSGHIGGGNRLTERIAKAMGATPVITTATDVHGRFAVDAWAKEQGLLITDMGMAKRISAQILERDVPIYLEESWRGPLPSGLVLGTEGPLGISVSYRKERPFLETLLLVPRVLVLGIGCRRGIAQALIAQAVEEVLALHGLDLRALSSLASIAIKSDEEGLLAYAKEMGFPIHFYEGAELAALEGEFSGSDFVKAQVGVDCVCERSAVLGGHRLIVKKHARQGVTVAVAMMRRELEF